MISRIIRFSVAIVIAAMAFSSYAQKDARHQEEGVQSKMTDTRINSNAYWLSKASQGLAELNGVQSIPPAVFTGSEIRSPGVITEDSPDVPVAPSNTTQSEVSIFVHPADNQKVLNSNNSSANPMTTFYGADALRSEDVGLTWGGTVQGPAGSNSGDPAALIGNNGWYYVNYINNSYGQSMDYSQNGGQSWTRVLVANAGGGGILDKNHMWIDNSPISPYDGNMYCAWTDFGSSFDSEIGLSHSVNNGLSWSPVKNISAAVNAGSHNQGANISSGPNGEVYAIWAIYDGWPTDETAIGMARSLDGGTTWEPAERIVTDIRGIRNTGVGKNMRTNSFPVCAADISGGDYNGNVYIVWCNVGVPGINTGSDADVYVVRSEDQGETWSEPIRINQDPAGLGRKHYFPWITSDPETGILSVIFYDDRNVGGSQCEVYCANSYDGGVTWEDFKVSDVAFTPSPIGGLADGYMGDYIAINARGGIVYPAWADTRSGSVMTYVSPYETNPLARPTNLQGIVTFETGAVDLNWHFETAPGFTHFNIFRDGELIGNVTDTIFQDMLPDYGIYTYRVTAFFDGIGESNPSTASLQWGDAHISVSPDEISEILLPETSVTRYVTVINTGELEMNYDISPFIQTTDNGGNRAYCTAYNGCDEFISRVVMEGIDNSSACSGYANYTSLSVTMMAGNSYNISITNGNTNYPSDQCGIWIDWDQDEEFDEDEALSVNGSPGVGPYTATIVPPVDAIAGQTRLRARIVYAETPQPCGNSTYGETEDYSIFVVNWLAIDPNAGNVMPGDTAVIAVTLDATGLEVGDYLAELRISSNDPDQSLVTVPIEMLVRDIAVTVTADNDTICQGDSVQLSSDVFGGSGTFAYAWTSVPEGFVSDLANPVAYPDTTTTYILEVTDGEITFGDQVTVTVYPLPEIALGEDMALCAGDSLTLDAGEGFSSYLWSTGDTTQWLTIMEAGDYWCTVTNDHGCMSADTLALAVNALPVPHLGTDTLLCYYHEILLDAGNPGATYEWSNGETSQTIVVDSSGMVAGSKMLKVTVTSPEGCLSSDSVSISFFECLGLDESLQVNQLLVYPNPGDGLFTVTAPGSQTIQGKLVVINGNGMTVYNDDHFFLAPGESQEINLHGLPEGIYNIQLGNDRSVYRSRVIIFRLK